MARSSQKRNAGIGLREMVHMPVDTDKWILLSDKVHPAIAKYWYRGNCKMWRVRDRPRPEHFV